MKIRSGVWHLHVRAHGWTSGLFWLAVRWDTDLPKPCLGKWGQDMQAGLNGLRRRFLMCTFLTTGIWICQRKCV